MSKVMLVDDEVEVLDFLSNFFKRFEINCVKASDGRIALELFREARPDWVLLDIKMPGMDGFEVFEKLKKIEADLKVMMITGRDDKGSQDRAKKLGAVDYIVKPLDLEDLHEKIQTYILKEQI